METEQVIASGSSSNSCGNPQIITQTQAQILISATPTVSSQTTPTTTSTTATTLSSSSLLNNNNNNDFCKEAQDLKSRTRKLQLEIEEKNEIINVLKEELETLRELCDKYQRENIQLIKDSKRVKFLQDENDFLQDKVGSVDQLEAEIKRLKDRLNETEFFKLRIKELEEDLTKSQDESGQFEVKWREAEGKLTRVAELEAELSEWKSFSNDLEKDKNSLKNKLIESIDNETKLNSINEKVEDEVKRLRDLIKTYEEERDEEQASNSLIMSVADLKQYDEQKNQISVDVGTDPIEPTASWKRVSVREEAQQTDVSDTAEKSVGTEEPYPSTKLVVEEQQQQVAVDEKQQQQEQLRQEQDQQRQQQQQQNQLNDENKSLKETLDKQESKLNQLANDNERIRDKLDSNKKMISDLRQDLACERSLTQKLNSQIASFSKHMRSFDKQYLHMHDTKSSKIDTTNNSSNISNNNNNSSNNNNDNNNSLPQNHVRENITTEASTNGSGGLVQVSKPISLQQQQQQQQQQQDNIYNHTNGHSTNGLSNGHSVANGLTNGLTNGSHTNSRVNVTTKSQVNHHQNSLSPSRQLNALIDPVTHEQLLMGMYQQVNGHNSNGQLLHNGNHQGQRLTEQQIAHLNNLHRQHYYHHLHQLHQMHHQHHLHHMHHMHHNTAKSTTSHQPSIKTSKILNISQQSGSVAGHQASVMKQNGVGVGNTNGVAPNGNTNGLDNLLSNLASIKLNDNLAFSSLRVPKKVSNSAKLNNSFVSSSANNKASAAAAHRHLNGYPSGVRSISSSNSPDKMRTTSATCSGSTTSHHQNINGGLTNGNATGGAGAGAKSSVWFEYGCI